MELLLDERLEPPSPQQREIIRVIQQMGGRIQVQVRREDDAAVVIVSDTGLGIPPDQLPALFTRYHRVPGESTRGIQGTGLGLLIVKEIVTAHGGSVDAESEGIAGKGSTFTVTIPLQGSAC